MKMMVILHPTFSRYIWVVGDQIYNRKQFETGGALKQTADSSRQKNIYLYKYLKITQHKKNKS